MGGSIRAFVAAMTFAACSRSSLQTPPPSPPRALLFGGRPSIANVAPFFADTWQWDGSAWTKLDDGNGPSARDGAAMSALGGRVVLFGGESAGGQPLGDTWEWDGAWHAIDVPGPPARAFAAMATLGNVVVMSGGLGSASTSFVDTWTWDGSMWTSIGGPEPPDVAEYGLATIDGGVIVLPYDGSEWRFDGHAWSPVDYGPAFFAPFPGPMTSTSTTLVLIGAFGSATNFSWTTQNGTEWTHLDIKPTPHEAQAIAACGDSVVLFGGHDAKNVALDDTWVWTSATEWQQKVVDGPPARMGAAMSAW